MKRRGEMASKVAKLLKDLIGAREREEPAESSTEYSGERKEEQPEVSVAPLDIILLDVSGSMMEGDYPPTRLEGAKEAALSFIGELIEKAPNTMVGIVVFSTRASIFCSPVPVLKGRKVLEGTIRKLVPQARTNKVSGLELSGKVIRRCKTAIEPRILLLTDGHANEGGSPEPVAEKLKGSEIQLDIIGIGGSPASVNEPQLKRMASVVNGELRYWFIRSVGELVKKFKILALREIR
jgi:Ca-activated chloride channel family protein